MELLYKRATAIDPRISIATVYRTVRLFEESGILTRHDFGDGRARYEEVSEEHHDHLINIETGCNQFQNEEIEKLQEVVAELGYHLVDHRLELYAVPLKKIKNNGAIAKQLCRDLGFELVVCVYLVAIKFSSFYV